MSKVSSHVLRIANSLEGQNVVLLEFTLKNGKKIALAPSSIVGVIERSDDRTKILTAGAGSHDLDVGYEDVFLADAREFESL